MIFKRLANSVPLTATRLDYARFRMTHRSPAPGATAAADKLIGEVAANGYAIVEDYWPREKCEACIADFERLMRENPEHVQRYSDTRIFGIEALSALIDDFHSDPFLQDVCDRYAGGPMVNAFTLANKVEARGGSKGSGEGWHKDSSFQQFKAFLYLNDIGEDQGPLQLLERSHTLGAYLADMRAAGLPFRQLRITDGQIERILARGPERIKTMTGKAGTLIVADTASIHRGKPPVAGVRYALTNYYMEAEQITEPYVDAYKPVSPAKVLALRPAAPGAAADDRRQAA